MRLIARIAAVAWLMAAAPIELAITLADSLGGPFEAPGALGIGLVLMRIATTAGGLMLGRHLLHGGAGARRWAAVWAAADLGTLGLVLASARLPSNRAPGDAWLVWLAYAVAAAIVVAATQDDHEMEGSPPG